jgi:Terminase large subunit, T4likevirus-type, N-terminal
MSLNPGQREVSDSGARFRVVIAGRRWGKTHLAIRELAKKCREPNKRAFYVAPTYRQAKQIVWDTLKWRLQDLGWARKVNESDLTITLINGSSISLRGADNPDSLRGVGLDFVVMDEFAMIDEKAWVEVLRPTLSDKRGSAMFISTPMGQGNWAYDLYQRGHDPVEHSWESFQYTTLDGGNVSEDEIEQARRDLDERTFRQEYMATFETAGNRIYYAFDRGTHVRSHDLDTQILYTGWDFNIDPMSVVIAVRTGDHLHVIDEIRMFSSNTQEAVEEIKTRFPKSRIWAFPDPASRQRKTSAGGVTDLTILQNAGFVVKCPNSHTPVRDRINAVNSRLKNTDGDVNLTFAPGVKNLLEGLEKQTYKPGSTTPDKDSGYDHGNDALGYMVDYLFPVRRDTSHIAQPSTWGHRVTVN